MRKKMRPFAMMGLVSALFLLVVTRPSLTEALHNLIINPDFEAGPAQVQPGYGAPGSLADGSWEFFLIQAPSAGALDTQVKHAGRRSYRVSNGPSGRGFVHSKPVAVQPGTRYRLSGWVKSAGAPENGAFLRVFWFTREGAGVPSTERELDDTPAAPGTTDWVPLSTEVTSPKDAAFAYVRLETNDGACGVEKPPFPLSLKTEKPFQVWFDEITLQPVDR